MSATDLRPSPVPSGQPAADTPAASASDPRGQRDREIDAAALADFTARHGAPAFNPVTVVVPAYGEAKNIVGVLEEIPREVCGLATSAVVVVDGEAPGEEPGSTAGRVVGTGHHVALAPVNRGQGAALRLGYAIARAGGAKYIVSLDADGQYDATEIPSLLQPILDDEADFVSGSRILGRTENDDAMRNAGVDFYARLISFLTGTKITDPANGLRAMRAELTADVPLSEPQYQASELQVGAIMRGWRVTERANTMRRRSSGKSKKQRNLIYGMQFARVVLTTRWRQRNGRKARAAAGAS